MSPRLDVTQPIPILARRPRVMPAEWARHDATWLAWPHAVRDWPGRFGPIPWVYAEIVRNVARGETVRLLVQDAEAEKKVRRLLGRAAVPLERVELHRARTDRVWTRDSGPVFVLEHGRKAIAGFRFDGWAKYPNFRNDAKNPARAAKALGVPLLPVVHRDRPVVLEGGAIDVNGQGTVLVTEECLLDPAVQVRNPGFGREDYEQVLAEVLGATRAIWLGKGIAGDDTHGHVDDLARFVSPRTIVLCRETNPKDENHRSLEENRERLEGAKLQDGSRPDLVFLPMPGPVVFDGQRLPASYANFYVCNAAVLVPTFDDPSDRIALGILAELFRDRPVVGIHALDLVWGRGTLHCLSQQEPAAQERGAPVGA
ncbi:MAG TPA: agmatine deiminase family protein [Anaeromyxobacter sp.]